MNLKNYLVKEISRKKTEETMEGQMKEQVE